LKPESREQSRSGGQSGEEIIMSTKLFVGNLSYNTTGNQLQDMFAVHGTVTEVDLIMDKFSGRSRGFAFVTMETKEAADAAIAALQGKDVDGRALTVNEARPREERPPRSGGGGYGGGRGGGGDRGGHRERY
jgi:RNA recognition motif-containing protein